jgi:hypothetical protein
MAIGELQKENIYESMDIIDALLNGGVMVATEAAPETLLKYYNNSINVYLPALTIGGGERSLLEARACGCNVEVELDNPKLQELLTCPIWDHRYYADQLKKGILSCLK